MKPTHIEHIGIAVHSLKDAIPFFEKLLGTACYKVEEVTDQRVRTAFFRIGESKIELLESTDPEGPVGKFLIRKGEGIHHIALAFENAGEALRGAEASGTELIDKHPRKGADELQIGFLHPRTTHGVLIELCSKG